MVHAVSVSYLRSEHMSPPAAGMALALHVAVALALWWVSPLSFRDVESQQPIEVTMEAPPPKPAETPSPPEVAQPAAPPSAPGPSAPASRPPPPPKAAGALGLPPPATPEPPKAESAKPSEPPAAVEPQQALAVPKIEAKPAPEPIPPPVDKVLPQVEAPPAPLTMKDFVKIAPPPAPRDVLKPLPQQVAPSPPAPQQLRPSPLTTAPQQASRDAGSSSNTFVNPADTYAHTQVADSYLSQVARKISQYRYYPHTPVVRTVEGVVVARLVIGRDGRLLDVSVVRSSGYQSLDTGLLDTIRKASPFSPLPGDLKGDKASFTLNIPYRLNPE